MRIVRMTPTGMPEEVIAMNIPDRRYAEIKAERAARENPNTLFAVLPDDRQEILSIAHRLPPLTVSPLLS